MVEKLVLPGRTVESEPDTEPGLDAYLAVDVLRTQVVDGAARSAIAKPEVLEDVKDDDIIELEFQDGLKQWVSVAQMRADLAGPGGTRAAVVDETLRIPATLPRGKRNRGAADWVLKGLKVLRIDPAEAAATASIREIIERFESKTVPNPGLYRLTNPPKLGEEIQSVNALDLRAPYLLLIHGTASSTEAAFTRLFEAPDEWAVLAQYYGDRILTLQQRTLSTSPVENALHVAERLPAGARIHLLTHSRGGLVGELLCLRELPPNALDPFKKIDHPDTERLQVLDKLLKEKNFQVERFVRVACPARGTILASQRIDIYFSVMLNLIGLIPGLLASPIYSFVKATLLAMVKLRTKPEEVPGLEAQRPEAPLIHLLNRPDLSTQADLAVIAGDIEGGGILDRLKSLATDVFFLEDHDLVVNTASMYGGMERSTGGFRYFDQGPEVNHFNYFRNSETRKRIIGWLTQPDVAKQTMNFQPIVREVLDLVRREVRGGIDLPTLFFVPGLMASHLKTSNQESGGSRRIWLDYDALAVGELDKLDLSKNSVSPDGVIAPPYQRLIQHLSANYEVLPFAYDWRLSVDDSARQLAEAVRMQLERHRRPIRFLAHSTGGLVVRAMITHFPELWDRLIQRDTRLVMLGTPNQGSFVTLRLLLGREKIMRLLALLDGQQGQPEILNQFRAYPGLLELLPPPTPQLDFFEKQDWHDWDTAAGLDEQQVNPPTPDLLGKARRTQEVLETAAIDPQHMVYVAGSAPQTPSAIYLEDGQIVFDVTRRGDGWTPYNLGLLPGVPTWYMDASHGEMTDYPQAFTALVELLDSGQTDKLSQEPPTWQGIVYPYEPIRQEEPVLFPDQTTLITAAVGWQAAEVEGEAVSPLRISVSHGSLRYASYPVAVGHYISDTIVSAEAYLNACLNGRLMERFRMDLYPGPVGTVEVIHASECSPPGGLVIGLGEVGSISAEKVRRGVTEAALRHALMVAEEARQTPTSMWQSAAFSTLLLGTQGGGAISVGSAVMVVVQAVIEANRSLRSHGLWDRVRIDAIEFVEMYEDIAIEAAHAAARLEERLQLDLEENETIMVVPYLRILKGGRYQQPVNPYATGWWRRIQIAQAIEPGRTESEAENADLQFLVLTDRARAEETLRFTQRNLIDQFIDAAIHTPGYNADVASALFELLLPTSLKDMARDETDLVLVLDRAAAQYPWELLAERTRKGLQPLAKRTKVIRQFKTSNYRASPQAPRGQNALVIGDPVSKQVELPGAQAEAASVGEILKNEAFQVTQIIRGNALAIVSALFANEYRVIHLAGHGIYDPDDPRQSGMILGDNTFLTAAELSQLRVVPEVVFINCCHLGRIDQKLTADAPHKLAASIAQELINLGVKAVIAAGWAVDDAAALTFAQTFYTALLHDNQTFGGAVFQARQEALALHPDTNTWGAYQCYGNPDFLLTDERGDDRGSRDPIRYFARREYFDRLRMIINDAEEAGPEQKVALLAEVEALNHSLPTQWRDGEMTAALARAWAVLESFGSALDFYQRAILEPNTQAPIDTIEQLIQLRNRYALRLWSEAKIDLLTEPEGAETLTTIRQSFMEAADWLEWLLKLGKSPERLRLLGDMAQELARLSSGEERTEQLNRAAHYYDLAYERSNFQDAGAALSWATLRYLLIGSQEEVAEHKADLLKLINECERVAKLQTQREATLASQLNVVYAMLLRHLIEGDLPKQAGTIADQYRALLTRPSSAAAALDRQLAFLIDMLAGKRRTTLVRPLETIQAVVEPYALG